MTCMYLTIFEQEETSEIEALNIAPTSLYQAFEQVTDGRKRKGKRYPLPLLLTLLLLGKLAGETKINGIVDWIKERKACLRSQLNWPQGFPVNSTYSEALAQCDAEQIAAVLAQVILKARAVEHCGTEPSRLQAHKQEETLTHVAMDGKTMRGTLRHANEGQPSVHLLSFYECQSGIVLAHRAVASKENEISAAAALLHPTLVKGRIGSHGCVAHPKEMVYLCAYVWRLLPHDCQKEPTISVRGYPGFLRRLRCTARRVAVRQTGAKRTWAVGNARSLDQYADE